MHYPKVAGCVLKPAQDTLKNFVSPPELNGPYGNEWMRKAIHTQ
jgi:hypothetical protein